MKLAFCVEDETDQVFLTILLQRIIKVPIVPDDTVYRFPAGGWTQAMKLARLVARNAHPQGN